MYKVWLPVTAAALLLAGSGAYFGIRKDTPLRPRAAATTRAVQRTLPQPLVEISSPQLAPTHPPAVRSSAGAQGAAPRHAAVPEEVEASAPTDEEREAFARSVFDAQGVDAAWSSSARRSVQDGLRALPSEGVHVRSVDCRSSLCRVELRYDSNAQGERYLRSLIRANFWRGNGMATRGEPSANGEQEVALYLAREGTELPEPMVN